MFKSAVVFELQSAFASQLFHPQPQLLEMTRETETRGGGEQRSNLSLPPRGRERGRRAACSSSRRVRFSTPLLSFVFCPPAGVRDERLWTGWRKGGGPVSRHKAHYARSRKHRTFLSLDLVRARYYFSNYGRIPADFPWRRALEVVEGGAPPRHEFIRTLMKFKAVGYSGSCTTRSNPSV